MLKTNNPENLILPMENPETEKRLLLCLYKGKGAHVDCKSIIP